MKAVVLGVDADALAAARRLAGGGIEVTVVGKSAGGKVAAIAPEVWASAPLADGARLDLTSDIPRTADAIRKLSRRDADQWPRFCERIHALAGVLEHLYASPPPDPLTHETGGWIQLGRAALRLRKLGRSDMTEFLRLVPMSIADLLDAWFESDALKGVLGARGVRHLAHGPRSGGTAFNFLHHHVGCAPGVFRQPRANADSVLETPPSVRRIEAEAARLDLNDGRIAGVVLDNGQTVAADLTVSALDPKRTLLDLVDAACLDPDLVRSVRNIRSRGVVAELTVTLDSIPDFSTLVIAPTLDYLERAYDHSKYGRVSSDPLMEASYDSTSSDGAHRVQAHVQYVPYAPREGAWDEARRKALADAVIAKIDEVAPGFASRVTATSVLTPIDLEARYGCPQGQAYHAEIALDQVLWMRPVPELARYRTPIRGLYLCGPAMHPGVPGAAGANAASVILTDVKNKRT